MSTWQKAAVLLPAVLSPEDVQLHLVSPTRNQPFREQEGILWESCTAGTLFHVLSVFPKCMELLPQPLCDEPHACLECHLLLCICCAILRSPNLGGQAQPGSFEGRPDQGLLPRPCLSSGTCLRSIRVTRVVTTHTKNWQFSKSLHRDVLGWTGTTGVLPSRLSSCSSYK